MGGYTNETLLENHVDLFRYVMVIGTFYIQSSLATNEHIKIEFEKVSGNEDEVKNLMLYGDYLGNRHHQYQLLHFTNYK